MTIDITGLDLLAETDPQPLADFDGAGLLPCNTSCFWTCWWTCKVTEG